MKRTAPAFLLAALFACGSDDAPRRDDSAQPSRGEIVHYGDQLSWMGTYWNGDYFGADDRMLWAEKEAVYLVGRETSPADSEGRATFAVHGRADDDAHRVRSKKYFNSRPAIHDDLRRGRWCYIPDTVFTAPKHMIELPEPPRSFVVNSKREDWHRVFINNTSELQFGRIDVLIDDMTHVVPTWAIRVENKESR